MQNLEFKAELRDLPLARNICRALGAARVGVLNQTDTYFRVLSGRLKKRECEGDPVEYVFYDRQNHPRPRASSFVIYDETQARERFGAVPLPVWVIVRKIRELHILGNVRIHLDVVEHLGTFMEFEALISSSQTAAKCRAAIAALRESFFPVLGEPIGCSYADLLARETEIGEEVGG